MHALHIYGIHTRCTVESSDKKLSSVNSWMSAVEVRKPQTVRSPPAPKQLPFVSQITGRTTSGTTCWYPEQEEKNGPGASHLVSWLPGEPCLDSLDRLEPGAASGALGPLWEGGSSSHRLHTHRVSCPGLRYQTHNWFLQLLATIERGGRGVEDDRPFQLF